MRTHRCQILAAAGLTFQVSRLGGAKSVAQKGRKRASWKTDPDPRRDDSGADRHDRNQALVSVYRPARLYARLKPNL